MILFAVVADTAGAHEADCVYSLWSTVELAEHEIQRLRGAGISAGWYDGDFHVVEVQTDQANDDYIAVAHD